ncbi:hypothetical protein [Pengzhenrongella sicca]|uniref:Tetratricopeptide repeat protein n=1 Tax=Pengzhenrongella sicca TaxID=2819238 RepID=A0A8A4ZBZ7_9MICO|nr:hypothetical protein [Pengzhenrongella sicca]QTE28941.1 hypothetical protein J4E96_16720 [Pengzhenrongella sicca]
MTVLAPPALLALAACGTLSPSSPTSRAAGPMSYLPAWLEWRQEGGGRGDSAERSAGRAHAGQCDKEVAAQGAGVGDLDPVAVAAVRERRVRHPAHREQTDARRKVSHALTVAAKIIDRVLWPEDEQPTPAQLVCLLILRGDMVGRLGDETKAVSTLERAAAVQLTEEEHASVRDDWRD